MVESKPAVNMSRRISLLGIARWVGLINPLWLEVDRKLPSQVMLKWKFERSGGHLRPFRRKKILQHKNEYDVLHGAYRLKFIRWTKHVRDIYRDHNMKLVQWLVMV